METADFRPGKGTMSETLIQKRSAFDGESPTPAPTGAFGQGSNEDQRKRAKDRGEKVARAVAVALNIDGDPSKPRGKLAATIALAELVSHKLTEEDFRFIESLSESHHPDKDVRRVDGHLKPVHRDILNAVDQVRKRVDDLVRECSRMESLGIVGVDPHVTQAP